MSFRRERFIPKGGPDGGDGGRGGDVILVVSPAKRTLYSFRNKKHFRAQNGSSGQGSQKTGKSGDDLVLEVPQGTIVKNADTEELLCDLTKAGERFVLLKGGRGGQGNRRFATSTNRAPRFSQPGEPGQTLNLHLELKLLADVGLIGLPNAGKSTLIRFVSKARPKVADYPFTTLEPALGVVSAFGEEPFVMADIPGLIEGAGEGAGLGFQFLKHIERTGILVHMIDASSVDPQDPLREYETVNRELAVYSRSLSEKPQVVVLNKMDLPESSSVPRLFEENGIRAFPVSAAGGMGVDALLSELLPLVKNLRQENRDKGDGD